jgi:hypothetical protein
MEEVVQLVGKLLIEAESLNKVFGVVHALPKHLLPEFHRSL